MIKVYGVQRTGTNYVRALLRRNTDHTVLMHEFGWKHGKAQPIVRPPDTQIVCALIIVKNPYSWLRSIATWGDSERVEIEKIGYAKYYNDMYAHYVEFLQMHWAWMGYDKATFVRYEDLLRDLRWSLEKICAVFETPLVSCVDVKKVENSDKFTEEKRQIYLNPEPIEGSGFNWDLFGWYGYET